MLLTETQVVPSQGVSPLTLEIVRRALSWSESRHFSRSADLPSPDAHALLARWKKLVTFRSGDPEIFAARLRAFGMSKQRALQWMEEPVLPADFQAPGWALLLDEVLSMSAADARISEAIVLCEAGFARADAAAERPVFVCFVAPFVAYALEALAQELPSFEPGARDDLAVALTRELSWMCARTIAHEIKKARARGELVALTSEERYDEYVNGVLPESRLHLFETYPVLARMMSTITGQFIANTQEIVRHLINDLDDLSHLAGTPLSTRIAAVSPFLSDFHNGGRSVWKVTLRTQSSGLVSFFYKPRSVQCEREWGTLLSWIASRGHAPQLQGCAVLDRATYGWSAEAHAADCSSDDEVRQYFRRQGAHTALITALGGQDFHGENFVAAGAFPVAIDCEGLFAPIITAPTGDLSQIPLTLAPIQYSGAGNLMLPYFRAGEAGQPMYSASGVGGTGTHPWPRKLPRWSGLGTDELSLTFDRQELRFDDSLPSRDGIKIVADDYTREIVEGIQSTWQFLHAHREELVAIDGPLTGFRGHSSRVLLRDTQQYADLMFWTTAPDILQSGAAYDVALETLVGATPFFCNGARFSEIVDVEKQSFWQRDIPMAEACNDTTAVHFATGETFEPILDRSAWVQTLERLSRLHETEGEWQAAVAQSLLYSTRHHRGTAPASLLEAARSIGDEVCNSALEFGDEVSWLTFVRADGSDRIIPLQAQAWDLTGNAGNAIFLADLARVTGEQRYATLARKALRSARRTLDAVRDSPFASGLTLSAFTGSFGLVYAIICAGSALQDESLLDDALQLALSHTMETFARETNPDWLTGAAGTLAVLARLHAVRPHAALQQQAAACRVVLEGAMRSRGLDGWQVPFFPRPLLGMAHGSSGIAAGLVATEAFSPLPADIILNAFTHERGQLDRERMRWPNLQHDTPNFMTGWCAGPAGFGMARLLALRGNDQHLAAHRNVLLQDLLDALSATVTCGGAADHHACCGDAGIILFLSMAARQLHRDDLLERAQTLAEAVLTSYAEHGLWRLQGGFRDRVLFPGLLAGQVGIGMAFLSVLDPRTTEYLALC